MKRLPNASVMLLVAGLTACTDCACDMADSPPPEGREAPAPAPRIDTYATAEPTSLDLPSEATAAPGPLEETGPYWNSWIVQDIASASPVSTLGLAPPQADNLRYVVSFDLASIAYRTLIADSKIEAGAVAADLYERLKEAVARQEDTWSFEVDALSLGGVVQIIDSPEGAIPIDLNSLFSEPTLEDLAEAIAKEDTERKKVELLSSKVGTGRIRVEIETIREGCGALALSLRRAKSIAPVEHLVRIVQVVGSGQPGAGVALVPSCAPPAQGSESFATGLASMLLVGDGPRADAALHFFPVRIDKKEVSAAFYIDRTGERAHWQLPRSLRGYLDDDRNLVGAVGLARTEANGLAPPDYTAAAVKLRDIIFTGDPVAPSHDASAKRALSALSRLVDESGSPPRVIARLTGPEHEPLPVPLGLLAAPGKAAVLSKPIVPIIPLPNEDYGAERPCARSLAIAIPRKLEQEHLVEPVAWPPASWIQSTDDSLQHLRHYFEGPAAAAGGGPSAEAFVLAAHHGGGVVRYEENEAHPVEAHTIKREFQDGSFALLSVCRAGGVAAADTQLARQLSYKGIDAIVYSPFGLNPSFGMELAVRFAGVAHETRQDTRARTVTELLDEAIERVKANPGKGAWLAGMRHELVIAGDPSVSLCGKEEE